ncbi:MAG: glycosyltransferase family 4 protein, partial [Acidimicrobiales bacterium]
MAKSLKLVLLVPHFAPDTAPTGEVITRVVEQLVEQGHRLHVITSLPWYANHQIEPGWQGKLVRHELTEWGKITRVYPFPAKDKQRIITRALSFVGFTGLVALQALRGSNADAVLAMSPPLTLGWAGWIAAKRNRAPLVLNLQDVYPDVAIDVGVLKGQKAISVFRFLERWSYRAADAVTVLSEDLRASVAPRADNVDKVRVIPNFVDTQRVRPMDRENSYRDEFGLTGKTVVMYAGN